MLTLERNNGRLCDPIPLLGRRQVITTKVSDEPEGRGSTNVIVLLSVHRKLIYVPGIAYMKMIDTYL